MTTQNINRIDKELAVLQDRFDNFEVKLEEHCRINEKGLDSLNGRVDGLTTIIAQLDSSIGKKIENMWKEGDKRWAGKLTEKVVYGVLGAIGLAVLYALLREIGLK